MAVDFTYLPGKILAVLRVVMPEWPKYARIKACLKDWVWNEKNKTQGGNKLTNDL